jgi:hypothetical protein
MANLEDRRKPVRITIIWILAMFKRQFLKAVSIVELSLYVLYGDTLYSGNHEGLILIDETLEIGEH